MGALQTLCLANCYWTHSIETRDLWRICRKLILINHEKKRRTVKVLYTCIIKFPTKLIFEYDTEENNEKYKKSWKCLIQKWYRHSNKVCFRNCYWRKCCRSWERHILKWWLTFHFEVMVNWKLLVTKTVRHQ